MRLIGGLALGLGLALVGYAPPAVAEQPQRVERGVDVIYRHILRGSSDQPLYVRCSNTGRYKAIWRGQWSTDKCGAEPGDNITQVRVPLGYTLKLRAWGCTGCRPWTLGPGVYAPVKPDRAVWLVEKEES